MLQERERPFAVVNAIGTRDVRRFEFELFIRALPVERQVLGAAAALLPLRFVPLVGEKMFERREQEGAKLPALGAQSFEVILLQEFREERLHQIFRILL